MQTVALDAERLSELTVFSQAELCDICTAAITVIGEQLRALDDALVAGDLASAVQAAHRARNETTLVGARELSEAFRLLQSAVRHEQLERARVAAAEARDLWPATRAAIAQLGADTNHGSNR